MTTKIIHIGDLDSEPPENLSYGFENRDFDAVLFSGDATRGVIDREKKQIDRSAIDRMAGTFEFINQIADNNNVPAFTIPGNHDGTGEWKFEPVEQNIYRDVVGNFDNLTDLEYGITELDGQDIIGGGFYFEPESFAYKDEVPNPALCEIEPSNYGESLEEVKQYTKDVLQDIENQIAEFGELGIQNDSLKDAREQIKSRERVYEEKKTKFESLINQVQNPILMHHGVPNMIGEDTNMDVLQGPKAPSDLRGKHYGSIVGREVIEENELAAYLGGHIHEGQGQTEYEETPIFNAGSGGVYELEFEEGELQDWELYRPN